MKGFRFLVIVIIVWTLAQVIAWFYFGIMTSVDSELYIGDAQNILNGIWPNGRFTWYTSYSFLVAIVLFVGADVEYVVIFHLLFSALAAVALYRLTLRVSQNHTAAFIAALLYVLWPDIQQWNFVIYTDSIFTSAVLIAVALIVNARRPWEYMLALAAVVFATFTRPVGIIFFGALTGYALIRLYQSQVVNTRIFYVLSIGLAGIALIALNYSVAGYVDSFLASYAKAEIIYPGVSLGIEPSTGLFMPGGGYPPFVRLIMFAVNNPVYFLKISLVKGIMYVGHIKPYFSWLHNVLIAVTLYPLYFFAVKGAMAMRFDALKVFVTCFIVLNVVMITLTSENWDGRFLLPVLPWVFMLSSVGFLRGGYIHD